MKLYLIFKIVAIILALISCLYPDSFGTSLELKWIVIMLIYILAIDIRLNNILSEEMEE